MIAEIGIQFWQKRRAVNFDKWQHFRFYQKDLHFLLHQLFDVIEYLCLCKSSNMSPYYRRSSNSTDVGANGNRTIWTTALIKDWFSTKLGEIGQIYITISTITSVCPSAGFRFPVSVRCHKNFFSLKSPWDHLPTHGVDTLTPTPRPPGARSPSGGAIKGPKGPF